MVLVDILKIIRRSGMCLWSLVNHVGIECPSPDGPITWDKTGPMTQKSSTHCFHCNPYNKAVMKEVTHMWENPLVQLNEEEEKEKKNDRNGFFELYMSLGSRRRKDLKHHIPPLQKKWESSKVFYRRVKLPESEFNLLEEALLTKTAQLAPHQAPEYHPTELLPRASQLVGINLVEVLCEKKHSYNVKHRVKKKSKIDKKSQKSGPLELQLLLC